MADLLSTAVAEINTVKRRSVRFEHLINLSRALLLGATTLSLWALIKPDAEFEQIILGLAVTCISLFFGGRRRIRQVYPGDLALAMEIKHPDSPLSAMSAGSNPLESSAASIWMPHIEEHLLALRSYETRRLWRHATTLILPLSITLIALPTTAPSLTTALSEVSNAVKRFTQGASLKIVQGATKDEQADKNIPLKAGKAVSVDLLAQNLIEINVSGAARTSAPTIELKRPLELTSSPDAKTEKKPAEGVFQSFQMTPVRGNEGQEVDHYTISFAVTEPVELVIPEISQSSVAILKVQQLPIPKVNLTVTSELEDPWPDDQPLGLKIHASAENPLQEVRLIIKSGQRVSKELVANVMVEDKSEVDADYRLILEAYVESDLADVEIIAEAVDRSVPSPLIGQSEPLKIKTASAYGRYREALNTLREIKKLLDEGQSKGQKTLPKEAATLANKASNQSERSPFFDGLDRVTIHRFESGIQDLATQPSAEKMMSLSTDVNDFLFEHEILDDRERDRDYFVAARALSRLIEQERGKRPVSLKVVTARLHKFLDDRLERWGKRVARLPSNAIPDKWDDVRRKVFQSAMEKIDKAEDSAETDLPKVAAAQLEILSKSVVTYRAWIEDLEAKEDKAREKEETERQQGLASARNVLRELQQRQGKVTQNLDRSDERPKSDLEAIWPATRMEQNANVKETRRLESQMRSLSPNANGRLLAAMEAMEATSSGGEQGEYTSAESNSDLAGRLLRQAERDTQESQQKRRNRGRRRRVTGDNYYGQSVVGGDVEIKREYQVDRRYREDILDEVQNAGLDDEQRTLLENYLRHVVR